MAIDLTDDERKPLVNLLTVEIEASKFPLSPRMEMLKRIRAKLRGEEPAAPTALSNRNRQRPITGERDEGPGRLLGRRSARRLLRSHRTCSNCLLSSLLALCCHRRV
jgi:hypothetical protein